MPKASWISAWLVLVLSAAAAAAQTEAVTRAGPDAAIEFDPETRARNLEREPPSYTLLAAGLYGRKVVDEPSADGEYSVQVWGLIVSPGTATEGAKLPGAAVVMLRTGRVVMIAGGKEAELAPGDTALAPEGSEVRFVNPDEARPAHLRAVVLPGSR